MNDLNIRVGRLLYGFCRGYFGRDSMVYDPKRVEAIGHDWIVVRTEDGYPMLAVCPQGYRVEAWHEELLKASKEQEPTE